MTKFKKISDEMKADMIADYKHGFPTSQISVKYKITFNTVDQLFKEEGLYLYKYNAKLGESKIGLDNELELIEKYKAGASQPSLSASYDICPATVSNILRKHNIPSNRKTGPQVKYSKEMLEKVSFAFRLGSSMKSIALANSLTKKQVEYILRRSNTPKQNGEPRVAKKRIYKKKSINNVGRKLKDIDHAAFLQDYYSGTFSNVEMASKYNVSIPYIYKYLRENNLKKNIKPAITAKEKKQIIKSYNTKKATVLELSKKYKIRSTRIKEVIGIPTNLPKTVDVNKVKELFSQNFTIKQIAEKLNFSDSIIRRHLLRANLITVKPKLTLEQEEELLFFYNYVATSSMQVCKKYNIAYATLYKILEKHNVTTIPVNKENRKMLLKMVFKFKIPIDKLIGDYTQAQIEYIIDTSVEPV